MPLEPGKMYAPSMNGLWKQIVELMLGLSSSSGIL